MPLVRYNATRSLTTGVAVGQQIVQAIPARYAGQTRQRSVISNTRVSMSGRRETYFERAEDAWSISTKPLTDVEQAELVMFLDSVERGETFEFEPDVTLSRNLLTNPGFETGNANGWQLLPGASSIGISSVAAYGQRALRVGLATNPDPFCVQTPAASPGVPIVAGQVALLQGLARADVDVTPNRDLRLMAFFDDSGGSGIGTTEIGVADNAASGYQLINGVVTAPASSAAVFLMWAKANPQNTDEAGNWRIDEHLLAILSATPSWRTCELAQFGYSEPRDPALDSMISYSLSIVEVP